jgi:hypothetical protein
MMVDLLALSEALVALADEAKDRGIPYGIRTRLTDALLAVDTVNLARQQQDRTNG